MRTKVTLVLIFLNVALFFFIFKFVCSSSRAPPPPARSAWCEIAMPGS
jgi:hypothetical protein